MIPGLSARTVAPLCALFFLCSSHGLSAAAAPNPPLLPVTITPKPVFLPPKFDLERKDIRTWITGAATRLAMPATEIEALLGGAVPQSSIVMAMTRPAEQALPWWQYRDRFLSTARIDGGVKFYEEHRATLERLADERGVPPEYLVAIIGVETLYGRSKGRFRVVDSLATLAFEYPPRAEFFRKELEQFLSLGRDGLLDPATASGSYAGAMGAPQFIPSSFRNFAVDGDRDGRIDVWDDWDDILASVANYFAVHGWRRGEPVLTDAQHPGSSDDPAMRNMQPNDTVAGLRKKGYAFETPLAADAPALLIAAEEADGMAWRVGFRNFTVITRYNRSPRYAMAVHDLARTIAAKAAPAAAAPVASTVGTRE